MSLLALAQSAPPVIPEESRWERFQGLEHPFSFMHYSGHPGAPPLAVAFFALSVAALIGLSIWLIHCRLRPRMERSRPALRLLSGLSLAALFFVLLEASLQLFVFFFPYQLYIPDPVAFWRANPEMARATGHYDFRGFTVSERPLFFDGEYSTEKEPGAFRIICLGDSQTMGFPWVDASRDSYPKVLQAELRRRFPGRRLEVVNGGISGYTSYQGLLAVRHIALAYRPDALVVSYCYHDGNQSYTEDKEVMTDNAGEIALRRALYRSQLYLLLRKLVYRWRASRLDRARRPVVTRVAPADYEKNLRTLIAIAREKRIKLFFVSLPIEERADYAGAHRRIMERVARAEGIPFIDGKAEFQALPEGARSGFFFDDVHFTVKGNREVGLMLARAIAPLLLEPPR